MASGKRSPREKRRRQAAKHHAREVRQERVLQAQGNTDLQARFAPPSTEIECPDCAERALEGFDWLFEFHRPQRLALATMTRRDAREAGVPRRNCETCRGAGKLTLARPQPDPYSVITTDMHAILRERLAQTSSSP